jgi:hypothetical protein
LGETWSGAVTVSDRYFATPRSSWATTSRGTSACPSRVANDAVVPRVVLRVAVEDLEKRQVGSRLLRGRSGPATLSLVCCCL